MIHYKIPTMDQEVHRGTNMQDPDTINVMITLHKKGWKAKRIARELGVSKNTVKRYLRLGEWVPYSGAKRKKTLHAVLPWIEKQFYQHAGNAEVLRQELLKEHGIDVSLRTVERAVQPYRQKLKAESRATVRFETEPGQQLQIDFGSMTIEIAGEKVRIFLFVATLGYSRRQFVKAFLHERQTAWLTGLEETFRYFGGVPQEVLLDNARALVTKHNPQTREVVFNERFFAFCRYWKFRPVACMPFRARTKGKDESSVGYVKKNCIAGRTFSHFEALEEHIVKWLRVVADVRIHGSTEEKPIVRFNRDEAWVLRPMSDRPPFQQVRELRRVVHNDACVEVDTNAYSVPWELIGTRVTVQILNSQVRVFQGTREVACHAESVGRKQRSIAREHLEGVVGSKRRKFDTSPEAGDNAIPEKRGELQRSLAEYELVTGGGW